MSKFQKRLSKTLSNNSNAIVVGNGFGFLKEILNVFHTVFVINDNRPEIRSKNLVYVTDFKFLPQSIDVSAIIVDRDKVNKIGNLAGIMNRCPCKILIEGEEVIPRDSSQYFYSNGYRAVEQNGNFHSWKRVK